MVKKGLLYTLLVLFLFLWFAPFEKLFYTMQHHLATKNIYLQYDNLSLNLLNKLSMDNFEVSRGATVILHAKHFEITPFFAWINTEVNGLDLYEQFAKIETKEASLNWSIFSPYKINIDAKGDFGNTEGNFLLSKSKLRLKFNPKGDIGYLQTFLKKDKEGLYYEKTF